MYAKNIRPSAKRVNRISRPRRVKICEQSELHAMRRGQILKNKKIPSPTEYQICYRSELWDHLFFDNCLNYLNLNYASEKICSLN